MPSNDQSTYYNNQAAALAAQVAAQAAQLEFQKMRFEQLELPQYQSMSALDKEKLAFQKATEVWNQAFQEASVTGSYNGMPAAQYLLSASQLSGTMYQPGQLNATQQQQYQTLQQQVSTLQQQLVGLAPGTPEYTTASTALATARAQLAPLQQILQGTDKAPTQTMAGQNQTFQQGLAIAQLTGIVPNSLTPWGAPQPAGSTQPGTQPGGTTPGSDAGLYVWMKSHGITLGDPSVVADLPNWIATYATLPAADHQAYMQAGAAAPQQYTFDLGPWSQVTGLPPVNFAPSTPVHEGAPGGMAGDTGGDPSLGVTNPGGPGATAGGTPTMAYLQMLASLTGMYNGQPTPEYQQMLAALTGQFNGQPTQAAMEFAKQFGLSEAAVTGMYNGQPTQAAQEFAKQFGLSEAAVTGMYQGNPTQAAKEFQARLALDTQHEENTQANQMLQLAASLRGPRNAFQQAKVIGGTPGGLSDILASVAGRYNLPGYQGGGAAPEAVNVGNFMQDVYAATPAGSDQTRGFEPWQGGGAATYGTPTYDPGVYGSQTNPAGISIGPNAEEQAAYNARVAAAGKGNVYGAPTYAPQMNQWGTPAPAYTVNPPGAQAPSSAFSYQPTGDGSHTVYPPGITAPVQAAQVSSASPLSAAQLGQIGSQAMASQPYILPSQMNAENYANLGTYRQDLLWAGLENQGWDIGSAQDAFKASLPQSGGPKTAKIAIPGIA